MPPPHSLHPIIVLRNGRGTHAMNFENYIFINTKQMNKCISEIVLSIKKHSATHIGKMLMHHRFVL